MRKRRVLGCGVVTSAMLGAAALAPAPVPAAPATPARIPGRIHHLNGATLNPVGKWAVEGSGGLLAPARLIAHLLLVETAVGLVLVDSALGTRDVAEPEARLPRTWLWLTRPSLDPGEPAVRQVERLGFRASDVTDLVLTHLDLDHAGGLSDFPAARVHVSDQEYQTAMTRQAGRYSTPMWAHRPRWERHEVKGDRWFGFESAPILAAGEPEIRLVALPGHSLGHCGVAVRVPGGWVLHAGDAYFHRAEVQGGSRSCPIGLEAFQTMAQFDAKLRLGTQDRLRALMHAHGNEIRVFSAHDPVELSSFH